MERETCQQLGTQHNEKWIPRRTEGKTIKRRFGQEEGQVRKRNCLNGSSPAPEARSILLISPGKEKSSDFIKDSSTSTLFFLTAPKESLE